MDETQILVNDEIPNLIYIPISFKSFCCKPFLLHKDKLFCTERINNKSRFIHIFCFTVVYGNNQRFWFSLTFFLCIELLTNEIFFVV